MCEALLGRAGGCALCSSDCRGFGARLINLHWQTVAGLGRLAEAIVFPSTAIKHEALLLRNKKAN